MDDNSKPEILNQLDKSPIFTYEDLWEMYHISCGNIGLDLVRSLPESKKEDDERFEKFLNKIIEIKNNRSKKEKTELKKIIP